MKEIIGDDDRWVWENGRRFSDIVNRYYISEEELLDVCEQIGVVVRQEGIRNVDIFVVPKDALKEPIMLNQRAEGKEAELKHE